MECVKCGHEFVTDDASFRWFRTGVIVEIDCPCCATFLDSQISVLQKPKLRRNLGGHKGISDFGGVDSVSE